MKKSILHISVDTGKANTKYAWFKNNEKHPSNIYADSFRTTVAKAYQNDFIGEQELVSYNKELYDVGNDETALESSNSKLSMTHEICVYVAITKTLRCLKANLKETHLIDLSLNVPLADFKENQRDYQKKYFEKPVTITVGKETFNFIIKNVRLNYEGLGAMIKNTDTDKGQYHIIDIGGKNDTHISFEDMKPVKGKNGLYNNGVLLMMQRIASDLSSDYEFTIRDVEDMVRGRKEKLAYFDTVFEKHADDLTTKIKNQVQKFVINPHLVIIILTGGGSILLKKQLEKKLIEYHPVFAQDAQFDNVKGMLEVIIYEERL